jgi:UDPglucose--hexose-1-phosphate uridylyltransferase
MEGRTMSELRQNLATKEWVVISAERAKKPNAIFNKIIGTPVSNKEHDTECPFCPGNENKFPVEEKYRVEGRDGNWLIRVIDNKFKILDRFNTCPLVPDAFEKEGIYQKLKGCGSHELVIDTHKHNKTITDLTRDEIKNVISVYLDRYNTFKKNPNNLIIIIFKNYGVLAGQTQPHSHTQVVGSRVVPLYTRSLLHEAEKHFDTYGSCVFCDMLRYEREEKTRVVYQNDDYLAFVPYAPGAEHETWIVPTWHSAGLQNIEGMKINNLADILYIILNKFRLSIDNPDFNFVIRTVPYPLSDVPHYHWHIQLIPRTKILGGFERGTRIQVNTILPEVSAQMLRECKTC